MDQHVYQRGERRVMHRSPENDLAPVELFVVLFLRARKRVMLRVISLNDHSARTLARAPRGRLPESATERSVQPPESPAAQARCQPTRRRRGSHCESRDPWRSSACLPAGRFPRSANSIIICSRLPRLRVVSRSSRAMFISGNSSFEVRFELFRSHPDVVNVLAFASIAHCAAPDGCTRSSDTAGSSCSDDT